MCNSLRSKSIIRMSGWIGWVANWSRAWHSTVRQRVQVAWCRRPWFRIARKPAPTVNHFGLCRFVSSHRPLDFVLTPKLAWPLMSKPSLPVRSKFSFLVWKDSVIGIHLVETRVSSNFLIGSSSCVLFYGVMFRWSARTLLPLMDEWLLQIKDSNNYFHSAT